MRPFQPTDCGRRDGYPSAAAWIAQDADGEAFIFRRFSRLGARNLLYLQAEVIVLERQLDGFDQATHDSFDMQLKSTARDWEAFEDSRARSAEVEERMRLVLRLRARLKEYCESPRRMRAGG